MMTVASRPLLGLIAVLTGCAIQSDPTGSSSAPIGPKPPASTPILSAPVASKTAITLRMCAGATGAPAGFSLHYLEASLLGAGSVWPSSETVGFCDAAFNGNASGSRFGLAADGCADVLIGDLAIEPGASSSCNEQLKCGTEYAFRAFAHASSDLRRSDWSATLIASTAPCTSGCTFTQGFWKNHSPYAEKPSLYLAWPVSSLTLGTPSYTQAEILSMFKTPVSGNGLIALAHQLAAAKLNLASGADGSAVASTIAAADALIGSSIVPPKGVGWLSPAITAALTSTLTRFNEGTIGPGHCDEKPSWSSPVSTSIPSVPTGSPLTAPR